jgi:hypothetical protein
MSKRARSDMNGDEKNEEEIVYLNICGQHFELPAALVRAQPATLLARMLDGPAAASAKRDANGRLVFYRDPTRFAGTVLPFYLHNTLPWTADDDEADYWNLRPCDMPHGTSPNVVDARNDAPGPALRAELLMLTARSQGEIYVAAEEFVRRVFSPENCNLLRLVARGGGHIGGITGWQQWPPYEKFAALWRRAQSISGALPHPRPELPTKEAYERETALTTRLATSRFFGEAVSHVCAAKLHLKATIFLPMKTSCCGSWRLSQTSSRHEEWKKLLSIPRRPCDAESAHWFPHWRGGFSTDAELVLALIYNPNVDGPLSADIINEALLRRVGECCQTVGLRDMCACQRYASGSIQISWVELCD